MSKILVITPKQDVLSLIEASLKNYMPIANLATSRSCIDGLQLAKTILPDVILISIINDAGGITVCEEFKKNINTKHIPIIMITKANSDIEVRMKFMNQGVDAFLSEPIDPTELISLIKLMLRIRKDDSGQLKEKNSLEHITVGRTAELSDSYMDLMEEVRIRKATEGALRKSQQRFELAMKASKVGIFDWNLVSNEIYYSPGWKSMLGYKDSELSNDSSLWETLVDPEDAKKSQKLHERLLSREIDYFEIEVKMRHKAGHWVDILARAEAILDERGNAIRFIGTHVDITKRKKVEAALLENQYYLTKAQEIGSIGTWELNLIKNELIWTEQNYRNFGVPIGTPLTYEIFLECIHPDDRDYVNTEWKATLDGKPYDLEHRILVGDKVKWLREKAEVEFDSNGSPIKAIGFAQDITERKQSEEALQESEGNLQNTFDLSPSIIAKADMIKGCFTQVNKATTKILGYTIEEFTSKPYMEFVHPDDRQSTIDIATEQLKGNDVTFFENRYLCKDGSYKWMVWFGTKPDKNGIVTTIGSDISERKRTEIQLRESEEKYRTIIETSPDGITIVSLEAKVEYVSQQILNILGYDSAKEMIGRNLMEFIHPDDHAKAGHFINEMLKGNLTGAAEYLVIRKDGSTSNIEANANLLRDINNEPIGMLMIVRDITERKQAEKKLKESENNLRTIFKAMTDVVIEVDYNGTYIDIAPTSPNLLYKPSNDMLGKTLHDLFPKPEADKFLAFYQECLDENKTVYLEYSLIINNETIWFEAKAVPKTTNTALLFARDITKQKLSEDVIRESKEQLELALTGASAGLWSWNIKTGEDILDERWCGILGYTKEELEQKVGSWERLIHPDDKARIEGVHKDHLENEENEYKDEYRMKCKNGEWKWIFATGKVVERDTEGKPARMAGIILDISKQKKAEVALEESERKATEIINNTIIQMWAFDGEIYSYMNDEWYRFTGQDRNLPRTVELWASCVHPDDLQSSSEIWLKNWETKTEHNNYFRLKRYDGIYRYFYCHAVPINNTNGTFKHFQGFNIDITERMELEEERIKLSLAVKQSPSIIVITDITGNCEYVNPKFTEITGYTFDEIKGVNPRILTSGELPEAAYREMWDTISSGLEWRGEFHNRKKTGELFWEAASISPIFDVNGKITSYLKVAEDITKRKEIEEELLTSKQRLEQAQEAAKIGSWEYYIDQNLIWGSSESKKIFGLKLHEDTFNVTNIEDCIVDNEYANNALMDLITKNIPYNIEYEIIPQNSEQMKIINSIAELKYDNNGKPEKVVGIIKDITKRKQTEENLKSSEEKLRLMINNSAIGFSATDLKGNFTEVNNAFCSMLGYSFDEILGKHYNQFSHPDDAAANLELYNDMLENKIAHFDIEKRYIHKNGNIVNVLIRSQLVRDDKGKPLFEMAITENITTRKKAEKALRESEVRFKALHNASFGGIAIHDKGLILECNQGLSDISGYTINELIGMDGLLLIAEEAREKVKGNIVAEYEESYEAIGLKKNGETYSLRLEARMIPYRGKKVRVVEFRDITDSKLIEDNLKQRMQELEIFNDASVDRELMINDHRQEINELLAKLGKKAKYRVVE